MEKVAMSKEDRLRREQAAFDRQLPEILPEHQGEFVVFKDEVPQGFYKTYNDAYGAALDRFGLDDVFLISEVLERHPEPVSISWTAGVMFGK
jgi:hypothetical protein